MKKTLNFRIVQFRQL